MSKTSVAGVKAGQRAFVEALYRECNEALMRYLARHGVQGEEAADIAQEAYCRISRMPDVATIDYPRAFLFRTAANLVRNNGKYWRRRHLRQTMAIDGLELASDAPSPYRYLSGKQELALVRQALAELPPKCQAVFVMHRFNGATYREIADDVGISVSMVEKYIMRALAHLKAAVSAGRGAEG